MAGNAFHTLVFVQETPFLQAPLGGQSSAYFTESPGARGVAEAEVTEQEGTSAHSTRAGWAIPPPELAFYLGSPLFFSIASVTLGGHSRDAAWGPTQSPISSPSTPSRCPAPSPMRRDALLI